jgi:hypothetical protein
MREESTILSIASRVRHSISAVIDAPNDAKTRRRVALGMDSEDLAGLLLLPAVKTVEEAEQHGLQ